MKKALTIIVLLGLITTSVFAQDKDLKGAKEKVSKITNTTLIAGSTAVALGGVPKLILMTTRNPFNKLRPLEPLYKPLAITGLVACGASLIGKLFDDQIAEKIADKLADQSEKRIKIN